MAKSHHVDLLSSGFVVKAATSAEFNEKLKSEISQIRELSKIYPDLIVPILHDEIVSGRQFYILEKKQSAPLSRLVFDTSRRFSDRRQIVCAALDVIKESIRMENENENKNRNDEITSCDIHDLLLEEWNSIGYMHELFDKKILFEGTSYPLTGRQIVERAFDFSRTEIFPAVEKAHFNFHFGNVLYDETSESINFIDPDVSVRGIDPHFGFSRFAFSFWHELATERSGAVMLISMHDSVLFMLQHTEYREILAQIPELSGLPFMLSWVGEENIKRFYALTTFCFLRSIRINSAVKEWTAPSAPAVARQEEVLMLGMMAFLQSAYRD